MATRAKSVVAGLVVVGGLLSAEAARASVQVYDLFFSGYYAQLGSGSVSEPSYAAAARVIATNPTDLVSATASVPGGGTLILPNVSDLEWIHFSPIFGTAGAMLAAYPAGVYTYNIAGGTLGNLSGTLQRPVSALFPAEVPVFEDSTFFGAEGSNPSNDLVLEFNSWTPVAGANESLTFVTVFDANTNAVVFNSQQGAEATSEVIPAGTLEPLKPYIAAVYFSSRVATQPAGLGGARSLVGFDRVTSFFFQTGEGTPVCLKDYNRDGAPNLDDLSDYITDFYVDVPIPGGLQPAAPTLSDLEVGFGQPCPLAPDAPLPYAAGAYKELGYRVGYSADGSNSCPSDPEQNFPSLDNLSEFISLFYGAECL
jgi:hypothetical protein